MKTIKIISITSTIILSSILLAYASFDVNLTVGSRGDNVKKVQQFLGVEQTGYFGVGTQKAVKEYQKKNGISNTGYWGKGTRAFANRSTSSNVLNSQNNLNESLPAGCTSTTGYSSVSGVSCSTVSVVNTAKTNDQVCQNSYGYNSIYSGQNNDNGGLICSCKNGYDWNKDKTHCQISSQNSSQSTVTTSPQNSTLCNGIYYSSCDTGNDLVCPTSGGKAYCQQSQQQIQANKAQSIADLQTILTSYQGMIDNLNKKIADSNNDWKNNDCDNIISSTEGYQSARAAASWSIKLAPCNSITSSISLYTQQETPIYAAMKEVQQKILYIRGY